MYFFLSFSLNGYGLSDANAICGQKHRNLRYDAILNEVNKVTDTANNKRLHKADFD